MANSKSHTANRLFPEEFIKSSIENYTFHINTNSKFVYQVLVAAFFAVILAMPMIDMDVNVNASGVVSSDEDRHIIHSPVSGKVTFSALKENLNILEGDTLLLLDHDLIDKREIQTRKLTLQLVSFSEDLELMIDNLPDKLPKPKNLRYQSELLEYEIHYEKLISTCQGARKNYERQKQLFEEKVISEKDFEVDEFNFIQSQNEVELFTKQKKKQWQQEIVNFTNEVNELQATINQLMDEKSKYLILSPMNGTLQNIHSIEKDQYLQVGFKLAEISPASRLIASCWVPPAKIGLLKIGQKCSFRIDAFNFYEWGMLQGTILEISNDAYILENQSTLFQVKCELSEDHLSLKNGFKGYLKKGMTLQSNFLVAKRSIFQLLYDKVDNWMNPSRQSLIN
jgi:HlyD family secretion protein